MGRKCTRDTRGGEMCSKTVVIEFFVIVGLKSNQRELELGGNISVKM
jgi:hypothetical protein